MMIMFLLCIFCLSHTIHFLSSIYFSKNHSKNVIESMEDILRVVIEEIDDIHVELASCLLRNLTKEAQVIFFEPKAQVISSLFFTLQYNLYHHD
jgi:hypothetical protein